MCYYCVGIDVDKTDSAADTPKPVDKPTDKAQPKTAEKSNPFAKPGMYVDIETHIRLYSHYPVRNPEWVCSIHVYVVVCVCMYPDILMYLVSPSCTV